MARPSARHLLPATAVTLLLVGSLTACRDGADTADHPAVAVFEVAGVESFRVELDRPELVEHVRQLLGGGDDAPIPNGVVVRDSPGVNSPWNWHLDPGSLEFADFTTEVCDGLPSDVEAGVITSDRYCPWLATVVALEN